MANVAAVPAVTVNGVTVSKTPINQGPAEPRRAVVVPGGSFAGGGPTSGQLFPVGNR